MKSYGRLYLALGQESQKEFSLSKSTVTLGRGTTNDIVIPDPKISRAHARLICSESGVQIEDLGSTNRTLVNGQPAQRASLVPGDLIQLGDTRLRLAPGGEPASAPAEAGHLDEPQINSEADLERTLADSALEVSLAELSLPRLAIHTPTRTWEVQLLGEMSIGRSAENDIVIDQPRASRVHARMRPVGGDWVIQDLNSTNGTWFRGERVQERRLSAGDTVRIGDAQLVFKPPILDQELTVVEGEPARRGRRKPIVVVPGFMGTELWRGDQMLWPNVRRLFADPGLFNLPGSSDLEPRRLTREVVIVPNLVKQDTYNRLVDFLVEELGYEPGHDLLEFPYDWRQDLRLTAAKLSQAVGKWREEQGHARATIIAHSLGCMVSRYFVECLDGKDQVERLILMGGPLRGVPKMFLALLSGRGLLPFGLLSDQIRHTVATFPSCYQIMPMYGCVVDQSGAPVDLTVDAGWVGEGHEETWRQSRTFLAEVGATTRVPILSIFGYGISTATRIRVTRDAAGRWQDIQVDREERGDASVPEASALLSGCEIHPVHQQHGALFTDNDVKMRLKLELAE